MAKGTFDHTASRSISSFSGTGTVKADIVAFLREGRLYLTLEMHIQSTGTFLGKTTTTTSTSDTIAILDRLE